MFPYLFFATNGNIPSPWNILVNFLAILSVFWVFVTADAFGKAGAGREEDDEKQRSNHAPIENADTSADGEKIKAYPDGLLCQVVRVTANVPQAKGVESLVVRCRELFQTLSGADHRPLFVLEFPLLFIGNSLIDDEAEHQERGDDIHPSEWHGRTHAYQGWEGQHEDKGVLIKGDEEKVEKHPYPTVIKW